jgi:hypothetical protein
MSGLLSKEIYDMGVMDFTVAIDVGKFRPGCVANGKW